MFSVYARYYNPTMESGLPSPGTAEALLFTIPVQNGKRPFLTAKVTNEMGNAGNFEFSVDPKHPYYGIFMHMRTIVRVDYDGDTVFYGRVLSIDQDTYRTETIHCEGAQTFLMDSVFEGKKEGYTVMLNEYVNYLITAHNNCMDTADHKKIYLGEVPGNYSNSIDASQKIESDRQKFGSNQGYKTVKDWLDELVSDYGGQIRVRYNNSDGKMYLDWMKTFFNPAMNDQMLTVYANALDLKHTVEVNNIFTHVIPIGKNHKFIDGGKGGSGGQVTEGRYKINVHVQQTSDIFPGRAWATPSRSDPGKLVTLNYRANAGFNLLRWTAVTTGGASVPIRAGNAFMMPESDVNVTAVFQEIEDHGLDPGAG